MAEFDLHEEGTAQLRPAGGPYSVPNPAIRPPTSEATPLREALVIRPGDHLIVRVEDDALTMDDADRIRQMLRDRLPLLSDVTVVRANGLYVLRDEVSHG
jgi:hypothetical protein